MDFTPELSAFQGVIITADDVHPFLRLTTKGGNEEKVKNIIDRLMEFLEQRKYIENGLIEDCNVPIVRKFALYIILNSDLEVLDDMVEMEGIFLVISTIPTLSKYLMCELVWELQMEQFLYEVITYAYPPLALQVAKAFIDNFKYLNPTKCLDKLLHLSEACYTLICRLYFFNFEKYQNSKNLKLAFENFQKCVKYFTDPPNSHKLNVLGKDELYKYKGKCLIAAIHFAHHCFEKFTSKQTKAPNDLADIYPLTYPEEAVKLDVLSYNVCDNPKEIVECLDNCNIVLLDMCKDLVMDVSLDIFCAWSEFEEDGRSMQQTIGELCYKLRTKLLAIDNVSEHPLVNMFEQIARKPVEIEDLINSTEIDTIVENINNNKDKQSWLNALVDKEELCHHIELLQVIASNLEYFSEDQCYKLYTTLKASSQNSDYTGSLSVKLFQGCHISVKYNILDELFSNNCFVDMNETEEFNNMMTEIFNKLVGTPDADITDVLTVFLQNPKQVYTKICSLATENPQQTDIMLRVMRILEKYSNHYYRSETEPCMIKTIQKTFDCDLDAESKQNNFIKFVCGLKEVNIISGSKVLLLIVMPNVHKALLDKNIDSLNVQIKLWGDAFTVEELLEYRAPMLAMLAQVVDVVRWKIHTYVSHGPATLELALILQSKLMETYNNNIPDNESNWLKSKLKNLQPLNMYYYRALFDPPGKNFLEVISGKTISNEIGAEVITAWLTQILSSCTRPEWCCIWESLAEFNDVTILNIFNNALTVLAVAEKPNRTNHTWPCLLYCYRNFMYIIRYKFFKEPLTDSQVIEAVKNVSRIPILKTETPEDLESLLLPLFAYLAEKKNDYTIDLASVNVLNDIHVGNLVNKVIVNGTA